MVAGLELRPSLRGSRPQDLMLLTLRAGQLA